MISRAVFARGANHQHAAAWRRRLALALGNALRQAGLDASAPVAPGTLGECFACVFAELGVDAESGVVDASKHATLSNRQRVLNAREASLTQRLLAMMSVAEEHYCPRLGSEALAPFTIEETQAALARLTGSGCARLLLIASDRF